MSLNLNPSLLGRIAQGDRYAFQCLYKSYRHDVFKFAMHMLHDAEESENMVHDLFVKIWDNRQRISPDRNFRSFLFTCLRNMILDYIRYEERKQNATLDYASILVEDEDYEQKEWQAQMVQRAMAELSTKRREIVYMCLVDGKSYQEIADHYCISKNTVKNQLVKAKQLLKDELTKKHKVCPC